MDILKLVDEIEDILEDSGKVPFSKKAMVDSGEILEIIKEIRLSIPNEIKEAKLITDQRERILADAQKNADDILNNAESKLEDLIKDDGVTKLAKERSKEIIIKTRNDAKEIRLGAMEYADDLLLNTQENLKELIIYINDNRKELRDENSSESSPE